MKQETYISVDVETSGPTPGHFSLLSIGACAVHDAEQSFYVELQPISEHADEHALKITGFTLASLRENGSTPQAAMDQFGRWIQTAARDATPVFVGFNAAFDWSFVNWYFLEYLGHNPFGIAPIDIKSFFMGMSGATWAETTSSSLPRRFQIERSRAHNALADAQHQAKVFSLMRAERGKHPA